MLLFSARHAGPDKPPQCDDILVLRKHKSLILKHRNTHTQNSTKLLFFLLIVKT